VRFERVTVLGVGLIGGSFARAVRKNSLAGHIAGFGRNEERLKAAVERGVVDSYDLDPAAACKGSDLVLFATPVESFMGLARRISSSLKKGALAVDAGSVKGGLVREMESLMPQGVHFVGCHPIAGGERSGADASRAELFEGALCIITKTEKSDPRAADDAASLWSSLGARVEYMSPEEHDRVYGFVSHLPHLLAYALMSAVGDMNADMLRLAGPGFLDTTRIALSPPALWSHICMLNRENLLDCLEGFSENVKRLGRYLEEGDTEALTRAFGRAQRLREGIGH
jgi:prephenate dehydrogenase